MSINLMYSLSICSGFWVTDIEKMGDRSKCLQIIYDSPEEFRLKRCHYSFEYDPSTQEITGISLTTDGEYLYPHIKFHVEGKDAYTSYYLE